MSSQSWTAYGPAIVAAFSAIVVMLIGGLLTEIGPWYRALRKPSWQPPDWAFAPAWTLIFTLFAVAGVRTWRALGPGESGALVLLLFAINCALNVGWSALFFRARRPDWALRELVMLWLSIIVMIFVVARYDAWAGILLAPYLAWVTFAGVLNATVVKLNAPFGARVA